MKKSTHKTIHSFHFLDREEGACAGHIPLRSRPTDSAVGFLNEHQSCFRRAVGFLANRSEITFRMEPSATGRGLTWVAFGQAL